MVLLKTALKHKWGRNACLPIVGDVTISEEGTVEVESEEIAQQIEALEIGFSVIEVETTTTTTEATISTTTVAETTTTTTEPIAEKAEGDELNSEEENELHEESQEDAADLLFQHEKEIFFASLEEKTVAELKELAKDFPGAEWRNLVKADLIIYLKEKLA